VVAKAVSNEWQGITASFFMLDCGSGITPKRLGEYQADPAVDLIGMLGWEYFAGCPVWESDLGDEFRQNFTTDIPTVIVHGTWDTSTPWENAVELEPYFTSSKLIPVIRGPHPALFAAMEASPEFTKAIFEFAATGDFSSLPDQFEMPAEEWLIPDVK
jgi:pimeloyl-ACP methyl ester carboxylesterase